MAYLEGQMFSRIQTRTSHPHLTALAALLDVRRAAVNQIIDLYHWDRWWEVRPELNFLDKKSLLSYVAWYKSMLTPREISLIPTRGLSFETHERDSLTQVISLFKPLGNSDTRPSLKRQIPSDYVDSSEDEFPLRRNKRRRTVDESRTSTTMLILGAAPGEELGTAVVS